MDCIDFLLTLFLHYKHSNQIMDEYMGIVKPFGGLFAPVGWMFCDGSVLSIAQYDALFTILGNTYGGDGITTFCLPDLRGRAPINPSESYPLGAAAGSENVTISPESFASHSHTYNGLSGVRESNNPENNYLGLAAGNFYCQLDSGDTLLPMNPLTVSLAPGGNQPHDNMAPFLATNYIICIEGIYPSRA
jgi:microcystin-dependent protein